MNNLHPLQSEQWALFREKTGIKVVRIAKEFNMSIHPIPYTPWKIGYLPKCSMPNKEILRKIAAAGRDENCIFVKLEPNAPNLPNSPKLPNLPNLSRSPHPLFTQYSFQLDLTKSEDELLKNMKSKTRYNIKVARKNNIKVVEETSDEAFEKYLRLAKKTWKRQKFYAHGEKYHRLMWETLHPAGIAHLLVAYYPTTDNQPRVDEQTRVEAGRIPLVAWILFLYNDILYYPYGASSTEYKNTMASNLMMWEAIKWGKKNGAKLFDMWGSLGPDPDKNDPWYGFHRFKEGYGGKLVEFVGSYDLILNPVAYKIYNLIYPLRQFLLKAKSL